MTTMSSLSLSQRGDIWVGQFQAMASPCEIHLELASEGLARELVEMAQTEALRIEQLFSRYRDDNIVYRINNSDGRPIEVDAETARILDFSAQCFELSEGLFDVTSGVLREIWKFDGSNNVPSNDAVKQLMPLIGWQKTTWNNPYFTLPKTMQIDLGGIGKEYAVDRTLALLRERVEAPILVNFGGDLHASGPPKSTGAWHVGIEMATESEKTLKSLQFHRGALTTSGDARRYLLKDGVRFSHVLNPLTGWPVSGAPSSVTVAGNSCTEAGIFSTLALLHGPDAERFLDEQGVTYWCQRS